MIDILYEVAKEKKRCISIIVLSESLVDFLKRRIANKGCWLFHLHRVAGMNDLPQNGQTLSIVATNNRSKGTVFRKNTVLIPLTVLASSTTLMGEVHIYLIFVCKG